MKRFNWVLPLSLLFAGCPAAELTEVAKEGSAKPIHFTDITAETGIDMLVTSGVNPPTMLLEVKGSGMALIDYDNDGDPDVFFPNGATIENPTEGPGCRLYENLGQMRFQDVTEKAGLTFRRWSYGAAVGDYDGNGFDDIYLTCYGENELLKNDGKGGFVEVGAQAGVKGDAWSSASAFGDIDLDGDLDLYVVNYVVLDTEKPKPQAHFLGTKVFAGPMGLATVPDVLYENLGDGTFRDISDESGIAKAAPSWGLGVVILDFDGDDVPDIYVGNDSQASFLFRGLGDGKFFEAGVLGGIAFNEDGAGQATMGIAVGDVDGNGKPDLFTTNFMYDTNTLHVNLGGMSFEDQTRKYGLYLDGRPFLSWAAHFIDFDHDTDEDLIFFNGHIYPTATCREQGWKYAQEPVLYRREGGKFERLRAESAGAWLGEGHCDRCASFGDLDGDGDIDMIVCERNDQARVLRNDRDGGEWLIVTLKDNRPGHEHRGIGSKVVLRSGESAQTRWIVSGIGFLAANQYIAHFGLAPETSKVSLEVTWTDGHVQKIEGVSTKQAFVVERD
jgi:enediyne biosynthesis protein E4